MLNLVWAPYTLSAIISALGLSSKPLGRGMRSEVDLVITTTATLGVKKTLLETMDRVMDLANGKVYLLTEPDADNSILDYAQRAGLQVVIVPRVWRNGKAKGRAIWYFSQRVVKRDRWYMLLDDDSYPLDNSYQYELNEAERQNRLVGNCVLLPRRGRSLLPLLCDNLRHADDLTIFRLTLQTIGSPLVGMHGEGLLVKGCILQDYWNDIHSIVEDTEFGIRVAGNVRTFQSRTVISVQSPYNITDFWKQRRRWYLGLWSIFSRFPWRAKPLILLRMVAWSIGWLGPLNWVLLPYLIFKWGGIEITLVGAVTGLGFSLLVSYYLIGAWRTRTVLPAMLLFPIYTTVESMMPLYAALTFRQVKGFDVIDKN